MHRVHRRTIAAAMLISLCLAATGCTTTRTLPVPRSASQTLSSDIKPGNSVVLTLKSGQTRKLRVTSVEPDALVVKGERIPFADIEKLQRRKFSIIKTAGAVVGAAAVVFGAYVYTIVKAEEGAD